MMVHILFNGVKDSEFDTVPATLVSANFPEILIDFITRHHKGEFKNDSKFKLYPIAYMAVDMLAYFLHRQSVSFPILGEKIFREMPGAPQQVVALLRNGRWYEALAAMRFFGFASMHPSGTLWLFQRQKLLVEILRYSHCAPEVVERHMPKGRALIEDETLRAVFGVHIQTGDFVRIAKILSTYAAGMGAVTFSSIMVQFGCNFEEFIIVKRIVYKAELLSNFVNITRQLMSWLSPGRFMSMFLQSIHRCMDMERGANLLFVEDFDFFRRNKIEAGWESLKYWYHQTLRPSSIAYLMCHALTTKSLIGAHWAAALVATTLDSAPDEVCRPIIQVCWECVYMYIHVQCCKRERRKFSLSPSLSLSLFLSLSLPLPIPIPFFLPPSLFPFLTPSPSPSQACGHELMDLAHGTKADYIPIQHMLLQALLKHGGFPFKYWEKYDSYSGMNSL